MNRTCSAVATPIVSVFDRMPAFWPALGIDVVRPGWSHAPKLYARCTSPCTPVYAVPLNVPAGVFGDQLVVLQVEAAVRGERERSRRC